jgi:hypothetical protein
MNNTQLSLKDLYNIDLYRKSGRLVFIKPIKKTISLNGGPQKSYKEAMFIINECIEREGLK